jgi:Nuclease-related domain
MVQRGADESHPYVGGLLLAFTGGSERELSATCDDRMVAASLVKRTADRPAVTLHNRRMPSGRGDVDHIVIAAAGVFVIDTKDMRGKVRIARPLSRAPRLLVDGWDRTKMLDGLDRQVAAVRGALAATGRCDVEVQGAICFTKADLPLLRTQHLRGHLLLDRKPLAKRLNADGPLDAVAVRSIGRELALAFPPA